MKKLVSSFLLFVCGFVLCYALFPHHVKAANGKISFTEIWFPKTTGPKGTLVDAGEYDYHNQGQVVGFSCVPSGEGAACYIATKPD
jgi:hypothetical protein